jgi:hypothetical protein
MQEKELELGARTTKGRGALQGAWRGAALDRPQETPRYLS